MGINEFQVMINRFHSLIENTPPAEKIKKELLELKEATIQNKNLTYRQASAISDRCDNYLNGTYGNTKTKENLKYQTA